MENTELSKYVWKGKDGLDKKMMEMDPEYLQKAYLRSCIQEYDAFQRQTIFSGLRDQLEEVAKERGIELKYPDELETSTRTYGNHFAIKRKLKAMPKSEDSSQKAIVGTNTVPDNDTVLEQKHPVLDLSKS